jgi:hypothetical protein
MILHPINNTMLPTRQPFRLAIEESTQRLVGWSCGGVLELTSPIFLGYGVPTIFWGLVWKLLYSNSIT